MANFLTNLNESINNENNFIKVPNNLLTLSIKENSALTLVYTYLIINRNMMNKTNVSISILRKDIFKTKNQNIIQKKEEDIINSLIILSNCITDNKNKIVSDSHIQIQTYEDYFDCGEMIYENLSETVNQMRINLKSNYRNFVMQQLSIIAIEGNCSFVKLTLKEYLTLMSFVYKNDKGKTFKIAELLNLYLLVKSKVSKNMSFNKKYSNNRNSSCIYLDKLVKESNLSRPTLTKYLYALCDLDLLEKHKKEVKIYFKLKHEDFI